MVADPARCRVVEQPGIRRLGAQGCVWRVIQFLSLDHRQLIVRLPPNDRRLLASPPNVRQSMFMRKSTKREFSVIVERDEEGYYVASVPELPGCHTQADSLDKLVERVRKVIELCLEVQQQESMKK